MAALYWLVSHTYEGVYHDAIIYALLAARQLNPDAFRSDLFFLFGSQDAFNLFTPVYAQLIHWLGFDDAARFLVLAGGALWIGGLFALARVTLPAAHPAHFLVLFLSAAMYSYSPNAVTFQLNENFATARVIAAPLVLFSLACWQWRTTAGSKLALLLALLATMLHPLLGIWAFVLFALERLSDRGVVIATLGGIAALFGLSMTDSLPLFRPMDGEWAELVRSSSRDVFVGPRGAVDLDRILTVISLLWIGGRLGSLHLRRTYLLLAMLSGVVFLVSQVCSYWWPIEIIMQSQPWRVTWLGLVVATLAAVDVLWRGIVRGRSAKVLIGVAVLTFSSYWRASAPLLLAALVLSMLPRVVSLWEEVSNDSTSLARSVLKYWPALVIPTVVILLPGYWTELEILGGSVSSPWWRGMDVLRGLVLAGGGGVFIIAVLHLAQWRVARCGLIALSAVSVILAASSWDTRMPSAKSYEKEFFTANPLRQELADLIPPGDVVTWPGMQQTLWFVLGRAEYLAPEQVIGIVFSRQKTVESMRRAERMAAASMLGRTSSFNTPSAALEGYRKAMVQDGFDTKNIHKYFMGTPSTAGLPYLCGDDALDWAISPVSDAIIEGRGWVKSFEMSGGGGRQFVYSCRGRAGSAAAL